MISDGGEVDAASSMAKGPPFRADQCAAAALVSRRTDRRLRRWVRDMVCMAALWFGMIVDELALFTSNIGRNLLKEPGMARRPVKRGHPKCATRGRRCCCVALLCNDDTCCPVGRILPGPT